MEKKRLHSIKARIKHIINGRYAAQDGFNPSYVLSPHGVRLSRVRIMATVVDKFLAESGKFASLTIDDGTETIRVKAFGGVSIFDSVDVGSEIDLIARVREYQGELYVMPEIITVLDDPNVQLLRELELRLQEQETDKKRKLILEHQKQVADLGELQRLLRERFGILPEEVEAILQSSEEPQEENKNKDIILKLIETLDEGGGCDYSELLSASGLPEDAVDTAVNELLSEGTCFEPRPGKIKKL